MANSIATITRYLTKMIDEVFVKDSKTEILENGSKFIDLNFKEAGYVKIYDILMDGLSWYYRANSVGDAAGSWAEGETRDATSYARYAPEYGTPSRDGFSRGSVKGGWELFKLRYYRSKQFVVDQMDDEETAGLIIGNLLTQFIRTKVVPEVDEVRFATLIEATSGDVGNLIYENVDYNDLMQESGISSASIIAKFNRAFVWLNKREVPDDEQVIFCSEDVWGLLLGDPMLTRFLDVATYKSESGVDFEIKTYMGRPIIHVPDSRFFTDPVLGDNGYYAGEDSKQINFIVCDKRAIVPVVKLDYTKIWTPETQDDFIGYKVNFALYHDAFIPKNKKVGVYASIESKAAETRVIALDAVDAVTGKAITASTANFIVRNYVTQPAGLLGELIYAQAASNPFTVGSNANVSTYISNKVAVGTTQIAVPATDGYSTWFALVQGGKTVATGKANLTAYVKSATFTVSLRATPLSVASSAESVATAAFEGQTLTVTKVAAGKTLVTVTYVDGSADNFLVTLS